MVDWCWFVPKEKYCWLVADGLVCSAIKVLLAGG
jgi:hypothetical protein